MKKQTLTYREYLLERKELIKSKMMYANEDGNFEAFRYYFHQLVKIEGKLRAYRPNVLRGA